jgi:cysteinyl-tRNA synthetase
MTDHLKKIRVFDTLSGDKKVVVPLRDGAISMYVCGVTVYDLTHIGHARVFVFFDVVQRFLRHLGYDVKYVRNHTDVDDKIIKRAGELDEAPLDLAQRFIEALDEDMGRLHVHHADVEPRVSGHIDEIIAMVEKLIERGYGYEADGDVYFRVEKFDGYGKLSHRKLEDMEAGRSGRVDDGSKKEHPFDFALWKSAKDGEISWDSPWGPGRPGWHIECSVMSTQHLGETFDIHGGGRDLIFPHHENEIAQAEGATGQTFANHWMHVGMVNVAEVDEDGQKIERKMSKSLGNFWTTRDVLEGYHPDAIRYFMHTTSYRQPITYSVDTLEEATGRIDYLYTTLYRIDQALGRAGYDADNRAPDAGWEGNVGDVLEHFSDRFENAMCDDFNTPKALALIGEVAKIGNELTQSKKKPNAERAYTLQAVGDCLRTAGGVLGFLEADPSTALRELRDLRAGLLGLDQDLIADKIAARTQARADKDWAKADAIRDELLEMSVEIMDSPEGTDWRIK